MSYRSTTLALLGCISIANAACAPTQNGASGSSGGKAGSTSSTSSGGKSGGSSSGSTSGGNSKGGNTGNGGNTGSSSQSSSGGSSGAGGSVSSTTGSGGKSDSGTTGSGGGTTGGGTTGSGGKSGGTSGSAGKGGSTSGSAGATGSSGGSSSSSTGASTNCTFDINAVTASAIPTVGVVTWGTNLSSPTSARIDFGLDTSYGMTAPVSKPTASGNKTLLLGMKQKKTYHYRVVATNGSGDCSSDDKTITTGSLATGLPTIKVANKGDASALFGGFLITAQYQGSSGGKAPALIYDKDGEIVWAFGISTGSDGLTCARMSYAGTHMWINSANVGGGMGGSSAGKALVHRVAMDGTDDQDLSSKFTGQNHQITVLPDETVAYYAYGTNGCDDIKEYSPSGTTKTIVNSGTAQGGASACHVNNIQYASDDTLLFSDLDSQVVVKVNRKDGSTVWMLNGGKSPLPGVTWKGSEHGIHVIDPNQIMLFNNNSSSLMGMGSAGGTGDGSKILQLKIDPTAKTVSSVWSYKGPANLQTDIMGDVQRLPNGNTIVAYSTKGAVQEVDKDGKVLSDWTFPLGGQFGYIEKRATLYGPPPR